MSESIDSEKVRALGREAGLDAVGVCLADPFDDTRSEIERRKAIGLSDTMQFTFRNPARSTDPQRTLDSVQRLVVAARSYRPKTRRRADDSMAAPARIADYAVSDYYAPLRAGLEVIAGALRSSGYSARVVADDNAMVDRAAAHRAGLGWFGKNANLLLVGHGSQFVLGSVLTDAPLETDAEIVEDGCGPCRRCITACPTDAIIEPGVIDARRCLAWLVQKTGVFPREYRVALADRIYGCDDCQTSCPVNRPADAGHPLPTSTEGYVDAVAMLQMDDETLLANFGRWYIPRREPRYLRRNALLVIANTAQPEDQRVEGVVCSALASNDEIIAAHAIWTARRLGRDDWIAWLDCPRTDVIQQELELDVPVRAMF
ncbi:MAG: tRNA epoxyqueuosine(34) reductase QueG [Acidobacteria bacterium]|nr:tRNA epoxyqueuosine(34) reductase QueG [Acidobacteriota bacterium]